tara:strand:+ start:3763 stop:3963 length:201 start_codon:yes stop_codon:yes gene_type:complete
MTDEIKKLRSEIDSLKAQIKALKNDLDFLYDNKKNLPKMIACIRELQEEVSKLSGQPVGIQFDYMG